MRPKKMHHFMGSARAWQDWVGRLGGVLLHWRLGESSLSDPAADYSGNGRDGTYANITKMTAGITGLVKGSDKCVRWDTGTSPYPQAYIADGGDLLSPAAVSYEWVSSGITADASNRAFFNKNNTAGITAVKWGAQTIRVFLGGSTIYVANTFADATPFTGRSHWLVVFDGSLSGPTAQNENRLKVYRNGAEVPAPSYNNNIPATITGGTQPLQVGTTTSTGFQGLIDEFIVHGTARDAAYALESYNRALP